MKKFIKILFIFSVMFVSLFVMGNISSAKVIEVNSITFPDENLRRALQSYATDTGDLDAVFVIDTDKVTDLMYDSSIESLKGIELLTNLSELYISTFKGNKISLDNSQLKKVSVNRPRCTKLQIQIPNLEQLYVYDDYSFENPTISSIDVSKSQKLTRLRLFCPNLTSVDMSGNKDLQELSVHGSKNIKSVNINSNTNLTALSLTNVPLKNIDLSKHKKLTAFACYDSKITSLNLSKNSKLTSLDVSNTNLKALNLTKNNQLTWIDVSGTKLKALDLTKNNKLSQLSMSNTNFPLPDLSRKKDLSFLNLKKQR